MAITKSLVEQNWKDEKEQERPMKGVMRLEGEGYCIAFPRLTLLFQNAGSYFWSTYTDS